MHRTIDVFHVYVVLILGFIKGTLSDSNVNETSTSDSSGESGGPDGALVAAGLMMIPCLCAFSCEMCYCAWKKMARRRTDLKERRNETVDSSTLYTIELGNRVMRMGTEQNRIADARLCNISGPPPPYDASSATTFSELPPAYDSPPPYEPRHEKTKNVVVCPAKTQIGLGIRL